MKSMTAILALAAVAACSDTNTEVFDVAANAVPNGFGPAGSATYSIVVENLTSTQAFTPALLATHGQATELFRVGARASFELKEIAENGNLGPMISNLPGNRHVSDFTVLFGAAAPPVMPGETVSGTLSTERGAKYISWVSMLICTNDGFTGVNSMKLPNKVGDSVVLQTGAYDAGTEINTEDFSDLVPPCPVLSGVPSSVPGSGMSNPALAEGGVIHPHAGIQGIADLTVLHHGWADPVGRITITRTN
jgi:Spondin_N